MKNNGIDKKGERNMDQSSFKQYLQAKYDKDGTLKDKAEEAPKPPRTEMPEQLARLRDEEDAAYLDRIHAQAKLGDTASIEEWFKIRGVINRPPVTGLSIPKEDKVEE